MVLAPWLLSFFSPDFGIYSGTLRVLALGQLVNALCGPVMYLLNMTGHEQSARRTMTVASIANVIGNVALIPWLGVEGAAWATSGTMILWNVWALVAVYRKTGIRTLIFVR
jgi:O-antigen/teichoic acid export membrane protein